MSNNLFFLRIISMLILGFSIFAQATLKKKKKKRNGVLLHELNIIFIPICLCLQEIGYSKYIFKESSLSPVFSGYNLFFFFFLIVNNRLPDMREVYLLVFNHPVHIMKNHHFIIIYNIIS